MQSRSTFVCILILLAVAQYATSCPTLRPFETGVVHGMVVADYLSVAKQFHLNCNGTQPAVLDHGVPYNPTENGQVAIYQGECLVVDLWCGNQTADSHSPPLKHDSLSTTFSVGKCPVEDALIVMNSRGYFQWDQKMSHYWPAFGQGGKQNMTVEQLFSNTACMIYIGPIELSDVTLENNFTKVKHLLEINQPDPNCQIGVEYAYSPVIWGWYAEVFSTYVDPHHRYMTDFIHQEMVVPTGSEIHYGIYPNDTATLARLTELRPGVFPDEYRPIAIAAAALHADPTTPQFKSEYNPPTIDFFNLPTDARAPSSIMFVSAASVAKLQRYFTMYGQIGNLRLASKAAIIYGTETKHNGSDYYDLDGISLARAGFNKIHFRSFFAPNDKAFGKWGTTSSMLFSDPENRLTYAYVSANFYTESDAHTAPYNSFSLYGAMYASQTAQTPAQHCATISIPNNGTQGYYCNPNQSGFYHCLNGPLASQSSFVQCPRGTKCACDTQTECSSYGLCVASC